MNTPVKLQKSDIIAYIQERPLLAEVAKLEEQKFLSIVEKSLNYPVTKNRWRGYTLLKNEMSTFVGFGAKRAELKTPSHYEAMIDLIDMLLPQAVDEDEVFEDDEPNVVAGSITPLSELLSGFLEGLQANNPGSEDDDDEY